MKPLEFDTYGKGWSELPCGEYSEEDPDNENNCPPGYDSELLDRSGIHCV